MCIIVENEADVAAFKDYVDDSPDTPAPAAPTPKPSSPVPPPPSKPISTPTSSPTPVKSTPIPVGSRILASPLAKKLAVEKGLDLTVRQLINIPFYYCK